MKTCEFPVRFLVTAKSTPERLRKLAESLSADAVDPMWYECRSCHLTWDDSPLRYQEVVCSNCYSERVMLTGIRLGFENWGKQNGGVNARNARWRECVRVAALAQASLESEARSKEGKP